MRRSALLALAALATAAQAHPDIDRIVAELARAAPQPFERTNRVTPAGKPTVVLVDRFDPRAPRGKRWTLLSVDGAAPTADDRSRNADQPDDARVPGFHRLHEMLGKSAPTCKVANGQTICHWPSLPAGSIGLSGPDFSRKLSADVVLEDEGGRNVLKRMRVYAAQPFSIMAVAKLHSLNVVSDYTSGKSGQPFLAGQTVDVDVSAPFGKGAKSHTETRFRPL